MQEYQRAFIDFLMECGAFRLGSFTLKSGRTSPTFLNTGLVRDGRGIRRLGEAYAGCILETVGAEGFDCVFGPAYKGVPLAVATAIALADRGVVRPYLFDRKERKEHGEEASATLDAARLIVGHRPEAGDRIVMVDDVLTTGATKLEAVELLRSLAEGIEFPGLVIALDRQEVAPDGQEACAAFRQATGVPVTPVVRLTEVLEHLQGTGRLPADDLGRCLDYMEQYGTADAQRWARDRR